MQNIAQHIALTLRNLRQLHGWSLDKTAQETGVSKAMLGQIERQESSPTVATLWKIANGFHTSFSSFLEESPIANQGLIYRAANRESLGHHDEKIRITPLFPFDEEVNFEFFVIELLPGCEHLSTPHEAGVIEHVVVVSGNMEILLNGIWQPLEQGEALRFMANQSHGYRNQNEDSVFFHNIIHYPATKVNSS
ncbi:MULTISPECIES: helix-turn-helix domain-containing protein [Legionella]|uniref:DNA-binding transcriptional regulator n=1 Tax=Legionella donaldsonii TaxID=45060 RepID=A0A378IYB4_9GAMM|nr:MULTISPECIES: XRE family transcriptional regulator [Legionella]MCC5014615.1 XRE family transcriptional regulator [Legionella sp. 31fI33]STX40464.1 DNA-binding transcriptional regulator [Legionella donaldsonii]